MPGGILSAGKRKESPSRPPSDVPPAFDFFATNSRLATREIRWGETSAPTLRPRFHVADLVIRTSPWRAWRKNGSAGFFSALPLKTQLAKDPQTYSAEATVSGAQAQKEPAPLGPVVASSATHFFWRPSRPCVVPKDGWPGPAQC